MKTRLFEERDSGRGRGEEKKKGKSVLSRDGVQLKTGRGEG